MKQVNFSDFSQALIAQAEHACEADPDMREAAAMVLVGDIYSLFVASRAAPAEAAAKPLADLQFEAVWPFIR